MAQFPVAPRYAKMLALGAQRGCLPYVVALVSALSVKELFVTGYGAAGEEGEEGEAAKMRAKRDRVRRSWAGTVSLRGVVLLRSVTMSVCLFICLFPGGMSVAG